MLKWSARKLVEEGQNRRVPLALVPTADELITQPEFVNRGALSTISTQKEQTFLAPGIPFILQRTPEDLMTPVKW